MLPSQRDAFDIPRDISYLNAAAWSPLPRASQEAGHIGVARKGQAPMCLFAIAEIRRL